MQYSAAIVTCRFAEEWQFDVFEAALGELGFDMFEGSSELRAYLPTERVAEIKEPLKALLADYPEVELVRIEDCEERNWNETWEAEHPLMELPLGVKIRPRGAFGSGAHETTGMMVDRLCLLDRCAVRSETAALLGNVLDNGCGTGVLGIMAARCGAKHVTMVDIDEQSVENARENIALNVRCTKDDVQSTFTVLQADTPPEGEYDLIMSNIHRNILLQQMPLYAQYLRPGGELWLSGFYESDCAALQSAAEAVGLRYKDKDERGEWRLLVLYQPLTGAAASR